MGREVVQYRYDAWGGIRTEINDEIHALIAELNPFRYRSYYYDTETNLYYLNTRYYDPEVGRFISQDDVSYLDPEHINGLNLFAYCGNNPVMNVDPSGTFAITALLIGLIVGAIVGAIVGGTVAGCVASSNGATGWELAGWIMLGVLGGGIIGGAIGAGLGAAAGAIFPGLNAALAGSLSFAIPTLTNIGGAIAIGSATVAVPVGALAAAGAAAVGVGIGTGLSVMFSRSTKNHLPTDGIPGSTVSQGGSTGIYDQNGHLIYRHDIGHTHFIKGVGYCCPHTHKFVWKLIDGIWRFIETVLPF